MTSSRQEVEVVVVGAGLAGLLATTELRRAGVESSAWRPASGWAAAPSAPTAGSTLGATWFWDGEAAVAETVAALRLVPYRQGTSGDALLEQPDGSSARLAGNPIDAPAWRLAGGTQALPLALAAGSPTISSGPAPRWDRSPSRATAPCSSPEPRARSPRGWRSSRCRRGWRSSRSRSSPRCRPASPRRPRRCTPGWATR